MEQTIKHLFFAALAAAALAGCAKDDTTDATPGGAAEETVPVTLDLNLVPMENPAAGVKSPGAELSGERVIARDSSRAMVVELVETPEMPETKAGSDSEITDLWVFQYNGDSENAKLVRRQYYSPYTPGMTFELNPGTNQRIVLFANTGNDNLAAGLTVGNTDYRAVLNWSEPTTSLSQVPAETLATGTRVVSISGGSKPTIDIRRNVAKVTFTVKLGDAPKGDWSVFVRNVPTMSYWMPHRNDSTFPTGLSTSYGNIKNHTLALNNAITTTDTYETTLTLPVNRRGIVDGTTTWTRIANAPQYATYLWITGIDADGNGLVYTVYLGSNFTTDYNLRPNCKYNFRITLYTDPAGADPRVETINDYTDTGIGLFKPDVRDVLPGNVTTWKFAKTACPTGYRLPTQEEAMLMWIYKAALPRNSLFGNTYWSSAETPASTSITDETKKYGWSVSMDKGAVTATNSSFAVRCVKDQTKTGTLYPFVASKSFTSRNPTNGEGVKTVALLTDAEKQYLNEKDTSVEEFRYGPTDPYNKVSAKFILAETDCDLSNAPGVYQTEGKYGWQNAYSACKNFKESNTGGFRLPTQRELQLIWTMRNNISGITPLSSSDTYWSGTNYDTTTACSLNFATGGTYGAGYTQTYKVRCVKDL